MAGKKCGQGMIKIIVSNTQAISMIEKKQKQKKVSDYFLL